MRSLLVAILALTAMYSSVLAQAPDLLSFQGYVTDSEGTPINHPGIPIRFRLTDVSDPVWLETQPSVEIVDGVFNVRLGSVVPLDTVRFDRPLLLRIKVGTDPEIQPHTPLAAAAYAKALPGLYTFYHENGDRKSYNVVGGAANNVVGAGVTGATIGGGGGELNLINPVRNRVLHDWGTVGGGGNNTASGRFATVSGGSSNGATGGNTVIGGGFFNAATDSNSTIGGGTHNAAIALGATVSGGSGNTASRPRSVVGGGFGNTASDINATVGGGIDNTASSGNATVSGGALNTASGPASVVGGGAGNTASGINATVPGGTTNSARGRSSFAAGHDAKAIHDGSFVWNDRSITSGNDSLLSTGENQFLIRAAGGVGIGTNRPLSNSRLHVEHGPVGTDDWGVVVTNSELATKRVGMRLTADGFFEITNNADNDGPDFARLATNGNWSAVSDRRLKTDIEPASGLLEAALELEPVRYSFRSEEDRGEKSLGLIAQDVQEVVPSLVIDGDPMTLNYAGMSVVAIGAIQGLYELVQEQQSMLTGQQAEIERMRTVMERAGLQ